MIIDIILGGLPKEKRDPPKPRKPRAKKSAPETTSAHPKTKGPWPKGKWQLKAEAMKVGERVKVTTANEAFRLRKALKDIGNESNVVPPSKFWYVTKL